MKEEYFLYDECLLCKGTGIDPDGVLFENPVFIDFCTNCFGAGKKLKLQPCIDIRPAK